MNTFKTVLSATAIVYSFAFSTAQANGFFNVDDKHSHPKQANTFDESKHVGTTFWGYYNKGLSKETPKMNQVASFDKSKHVGNPFWDYHSN